MAEFRRTFTDTMAREKAQDKIQKDMRMQQGDLDDYIAKFERQARVAEYDLDNALTIDLFIKGLPKDLVEKALQLDEPRTYNEWKDAVSRRQQQYFFIKTRLDSFKKPTQNTPRPGAWVPRGQWNPRGGWRGNNRPRDPNAMDTSADRTRGRLANAEEVLEEDARRRGPPPPFKPRGGFFQRGNRRDLREVTCFTFQRKGHLSRDCPQHMWNQPRYDAGPSRNRRTESAFPI